MDKFWDEHWPILKKIYNLSDSDKDSHVHLYNLFWNEVHNARPN